MVRAPAERGTVWFCSNHLSKAGYRQDQIATGGSLKEGGKEGLLVTYSTPANGKKGHDLLAVRGLSNGEFACFKWPLCAPLLLYNYGCCKTDNLGVS